VYVLPDDVTVDAEMGELLLDVAERAEVLFRMPGGFHVTPVVEE